MENLTGRTIGSYRLEEEIGRGGAATVYKALQPELDRWVAIKVLDPVYITDDAEALARFRYEVKTIAGLHHPNILTIYAYGETQGLEYIVMEYVEGGSLKDRLAEAPFTWPRAVNLAVGLGHALAFAHSHGIVHHDVKPANVLMAGEDWPLLADFGLAKIRHDCRTVSGQGAAVGTPFYTSPEQAMGEAVDHRADVYALGVLLFEMLTGRPPFVSERPLEVLVMHMTAPPPRPRQIVGEIPLQLEAVIMKALEKLPDHRYASMQDMVTDLEATLSACLVSEQPALAPLGAEVCPPGTEAGGPAPPLVYGPHFTIVGTSTPLPLPAQSPVVIGRADPRGSVRVDLDLSIFGNLCASVSRQHARLTRVGDMWTIEDLCSTNGTYVNEQPVFPFEPELLSDGDRVRLGSLVLVFHTGESMPSIENQTRPL